MVTAERVTQIKKHHHSSQSLIAKSGQCLSFIKLFHNRVLFLALSVLPPKPLDLTKKRPGKRYSQCYTPIFLVPRVFWAFEHHSDTATLARLCCVTLGPSLHSGTCYRFSSKELGKRKHWPDEEQQIIVPIHQNLLLKHPLCPREIRSKDLSNPMTTEGSGRATWSSGRYLFPMAGAWNYMIFKVPANPNHSLTLWSTSWRFVFYL